jgi:3-methylcrotonyl-CoA carboxylase alpha subunit/geranyl-CoA carboxylase alpha subunit
MRILIANRGEIARRIQRTAHRLGHETVAAWADPDREAPFVRGASVATRLGPAALDGSYLCSDAWLEAARRTAATAVHPGYGFLAESAAFADAVTAAGLTWIGPHAKAIETMGSKIRARAVAVAAGVPTIPGFDASQDPDALAGGAARIGYPVLVKAAAGGGGKGIRIVRAPDDFAAALEEARREAGRSFGDEAVIVERYVERARHVEVQVVGDRHGHVIDLGTRECSVQRRYQKLLEEAPAPNLPAATESGLRRSARELAASMDYDSAGTVEFVVDDASGEYFFLEMNTRLQVEHPVTEAITGLDLVELQVHVAEGRPLPIAPADLVQHGHAFEARINAEDPARGFAPEVGRVTDLRVPDGVRWESGVEAGSEITSHYDPMIAKLIVHGADRELARRRLGAALDALIVGGVTTNAGFQRWLIDQPPVALGRVTTRFLDEHPYAPPEEPELDAAALAATAWTAARSAGRGAEPWAALESFRLTPHRPRLPVALADHRGEVCERQALSARLHPEDGMLVVDAGDASLRVPVLVDLAAHRVALNRAGATHTFRVLTRSEHWAAGAKGAGHGDVDAVRSPFPAVVTDLPRTAGERVASGDVVAVIEAMKMLHSLTAKGSAVVARVHVAVGDAVEGNQVLVSFEAESGGSPGNEEGRE